MNSIKKKAFITGVTGQDGSFLAEFLLNKNYIVHGLIRRASTFNTERIEHLMNNDNFILHYGDVTDSANINRLIAEIKPDEIYHLAAQSHVQVSFEMPLYTGQVDAIGTLVLLDAIKTHCPSAKIYQASTSELFGKVQEIPQKETTPFYPRSPYGVAKIYSYWMIKNYREAYKIFACNGILFNHESEQRGKTFVTRKITCGFAKLKNNLTSDSIKLGNLDSKRDWGYAPEYIMGMYQILQQDKPDDYVLATGEMHSIREFCEEAAKYCGWEIVWKGTGVNEKGIDKKTGKILVEIDPKYFRPAEVDLLIGDATKANQILGWEPKVKFKELVKIMMEHDLKTIK